MDVLAELWRRAISVQPAPAPEVVVLVAAVAACCVLLPRAWVWTRQLVTISHEGAHALAAVVVGRRLMGIRLHSDTSGLTVSSGRAGGAGMVMMLAAGYLGPAVAGLGSAALLLGGYSLGLLWLLVLWLSLMLLQIRNAYGFLVLVVCGLATAAVSWYLPATAQSLIAYLVTWLLLLGAPKPVLELIAQRRRRAATHSDADQLARLTPVPAGIWVVLFLVSNLAGLALGVSLLLPEAF